MSKRILVITPRFPEPASGACEQDRAENLRQLPRLGYEIEVIGKLYTWQDPEEIRAKWKASGVPLTLVPYRYIGGGWREQLERLRYTLPHPGRLDPATLEYVEPRMRDTVREAVKRFQPDIVWCDYTYLWPLFRLIPRATPIVVRSINFEARHFLEEDGRTLFNYLRSLPKFYTEYISGRRAGVLFSITPDEEQQYQRWGARHAVNLPLRGFSHTIGTHTPPGNRQPLKVFFMGSTYHVSHNRQALEFVVRQVAPRVFKKFGDAFQFHIFGMKFPADLQSFIRDNVHYEGYVDDLNAALQPMDIAMIPSLSGAGMQQKIFEPLARGFPTITHGRGVPHHYPRPGAGRLSVPS
ncbi:MAG: glycosyltransferase [Candidatus Magasanikbacteria bacterium]|nr:glycosyltransferase [Candidatus Magasanikbacteria bacterium]